MEDKHHLNKKLVFHDTQTGDPPFRPNVHWDHQLKSPNVGGIGRSAVTGASLVALLLAWGGEVHGLETPKVSQWLSAYNWDF